MPDWMLLVGAMGGLITTWIAILFAAYRGIKAFQVWLQTSVIEPYIMPLQESISTIQADISATRAIQTRNGIILKEHEKYIYILLGKQFGAIPDLGDENAHNT